jgi:pectate lyase
MLDEFKIGGQGHRAKCRVPVLLLLILFGCSAFVSSPAQPTVPAFPGAVGFGSVTSGGRGGRVIFVTNLDDAGSGSLRAACLAGGPRIIIFRTGGTIRLKGNIVVHNPYMTIAGQTAPGGGICVRGGALTIAAHDVIVRGMRFRVGDEPAGPNPDDRDSLQMDNHGGNCYRVIIDHCSISWAVDEDVEIWTPGAHDITISNSIISEGLYRSLHPKGPHSMGLIIGFGTRNITVYGNLLAHNNERNPRVQATRVEVINNVVYDAGRMNVDIGSGTEPEYVSVIGNYFKKGPSWRANPFPVFVRQKIYPGSRIYVSDNIAIGYADLCNDSSHLTGSVPFAASGVAAQPAKTVFDQVLENAGASPQHPDAVDARIIRETRDGTGHIIDSVAQVGGWPTLGAGTPPVDSDNDGMPDQWETAKGLNPNSAADARAYRSDGYTNLEAYLNSFYAGVRAASPDR